MKKSVIFLIFFIIHFSFIVVQSQSWQELYDSANANMQSQNYKVAIEWGEKALVQAEKEFGKVDTNYINTLMFVCNIYRFSPDKKNAIKHCLDAFILIKENFGENNIYYLKFEIFLGIVYYYNGDFKESEKYYLSALGKFRSYHNNDNFDFAELLQNLAVLYSLMGQYAEAEKLLMEGYEMYKKLFNGDSPDLVLTLNTFASIYDKAGNYEKAEKYFQESLDMSRRLSKQSTEFNDYGYLAFTVNNMAAFYLNQKEYKKAEPLFIEGLNFRRDHYKKDKEGNPDLALGINNMAMFYVKTGQLEKAEPLFIEALEMNRKWFKGEHRELVTNINNMAMYYWHTKNYEKAEPLFIEALKMVKDLYSGDNLDYVHSIKNLSDFYIYQKRYSEAEPLFLEVLRVFNNMKDNYFPSLSEKEKQLYWNTMKDKFEAFNSFAIKRAKENPKVLCDMYDNQLNTKALLFHSSSKIKRRILNSKDSLLITEFENWLSLREELVKIYTMTNKELLEKNINLDSIVNIANELEKELSNKSEQFADNYEKKKITWKTIQTFLQPGEAAIEIIRFMYIEKDWTDSIIYVALIITEHTNENPEIVIFENGNELENKYFKLYKNNIKRDILDKESFKNYWSKIYEKLNDIKRVYLSPDGVYNKLNPSTLLKPDGKYLIETQDILILNSTKDIVTNYYKSRQETKMLNSAELFGNPKFKTNQDENLDSEEDYFVNREYNEPYINCDSVRGYNIIELPGTENEVKIIEEFLKSKSWVVNIHLGEASVKSAVKSVINPRVLHIATHGFFLSDFAYEQENMFGIESKMFVENPLLRSGLLFSGSGNFLNNNVLISNEEDNGILTAYEAMNLDLNNTELVVLSACETGLGVIQNGEGVYGLQRAFQTAGAKTVLMSLWTVGDRPTKELMTMFYDNWVSGMTKREAFKEAQLELKKIYNNPYYWGAFVMVGE